MISERRIIELKNAAQAGRIRDVSKLVALAAETGSVIPNALVEGLRKGTHQALLLPIMETVCLLERTPDAMFEFAGLDIWVRSMKTHFSDEIFRSEEHTSELQSLMRISYAVFCLKKKKQLKQHTEDRL